MTSQAVLKDVPSEYKHTAIAAIASGDVMQTPNGRAAVRVGLDAAAIGDVVTLVDEGQYTIQKTASQVWLDGCRLWFDHSTGKATCIPPFTDKDFYLGVAVGDAASSATAGVVNLNVERRGIIELHRDPGDTLRVLTSGNPLAYMAGGTLNFEFSATAEAQKLDWISKRSFPVSSDWIFEALFEVAVTADADVADLSVGVVNATHASDADAITESVLFHADLGADLDLDAESDDGTTEVAATDTTVNLVAGTPVLVALDGRDPSDVKYYVNGAEVNAVTANLGNIAVAAGPLKAIFHLEKSSNDSLCHVRLHDMSVRLIGQE